MEELTIREFTLPFDLTERIAICENKLEDKFYEGTINNLFASHDDVTLDMSVTKVCVRDGIVHIIAHF